MLLLIRRLLTHPQQIIPKLMLVLQAVVPIVFVSNYLPLFLKQSVKHYEISMCLLHELVELVKITGYQVLMSTHGLE